MARVNNFGTDLLRLPRLVRWVFLGVALSALGSGLTMPFFFVYLTQIRGLATVTVGLLMGSMGVLSLIAAPICGTLVDRFGPRVVAVVGQVITFSGVVVLMVADALPKATLAGALIAVGHTTSYPAFAALLARLVEPERRQDVFGLQFMLLNAGLGIGGLIGSAMVSMDDVSSFQRLYVLDAASYLLFGLVMALLPAGTGRLPVAGAQEASGGASSVGTAGQVAGVAQAAAEETGGWREVLADRAMLRFVAVTAFLLTFGYAQMETGFTAYAVTVAGVEPRVLGWAFAGNTAAIVLGQLFALRFVRGRRRSSMLALTALLWALSWAIVSVSGVPVVSAGAGAALCIVVGLTLFGLGETLFSPTAPALVNDLAPEPLRGRYNSLQGLTWTTSSIVGPALAGLLIGTGHPQLWVAATVGGATISALLYLRLRTHLTDAADGVGPSEPTSAEPTDHEGRGAATHAGEVPDGGAEPASGVGRAGAIGSLSGVAGTEPAVARTTDPAAACTTEPAVARTTEPAQAAAATVPAQAVRRAGSA